MNQRILLVGTLPEWELHHAWQLALAEAHATQGDEVLIFTCTGDRIACEANFGEKLDREKCAGCIAKRRDGLRALSQAHVGAKTVAAPAIPRPCTPPFIEDIASLKSFFHENLDAGLAALSSWIELSRRTSPDTLVDWAQINLLVREAVDLYTKALSLIRNTQPTKVAIFNGRLVSTRPWVRACEASNTPYYCYDHGPTFESIRRFDNFTVHSIAGWRNSCNEFWENRPSDKYAEDAAERFFNNRRQRKDQLTAQFLKNQTQKHVPSLGRPETRWIAIFLSSDDEFAAIGEEWSGGVYPDQWAGVKALCSDQVLKSRGFRFVVRVHPRLQFINNVDWLRFSERQDELNAIIIPPADPTDSYELAALAEKTISFGSSMGIEAAYMGRPSILLGPSFYSHLGACYQPTSHEQVVDMILADNLPPLPKSGAVKFGYFLASAGDKLPGLEKTSEGQVVFRGGTTNSARLWPQLQALPWRIQAYVRAHPSLGKFLRSALFILMRLRFFLYTVRRNYSAGRVMKRTTTWKRA
jgi:hypothetical protein